MDDGETATQDWGMIWLVGKAGNPYESDAGEAVSYTTTPVPEWYSNILRQRLPSKQAILRVVSLELVRLWELGCTLRDKGYDLLADALDDQVIAAQWAIVNRVWELLGGGAIESQGGGDAGTEEMP